MDLDLGCMWIGIYGLRFIVCVRVWNKCVYGPMFSVCVFWMEYMDLYISVYACLIWIYGPRFVMWYMDLDEMCVW